MIKEIKREENTKLYVAKRDDNDLYIECIEHKKGEHSKPIAIYFYSAKTILKHKNYCYDEIKPFIDFLESENNKVNDIQDII